MLIVISPNIKLLLISIYATSAVTFGRIGSGKIVLQNKQQEGKLADHTEKCLHLNGYLEY